MNANCIGFYYTKESNNKKKDNKWIKASLEINAQIDRYNLEIKPILEDDDIYDEDEDERIQKLPRKFKLSDYKMCEPRGSQKFNDYTIHVLILTAKLFAKAKKLFLAFFNEEIRLSWFQNLEIILTHKFQNLSPIVIGMPTTDNPSNLPIEQFMIENDVYEGSLLPGEFYATVVETTKSKEIGIKGRYILAVTDIGIDLKDEYNESLEKSWEIRNMRRFGENDNVFFMELGKYCDDGQGFLSFKVDKGKQLIKELLHAKDLCMKNKSKRLSAISQFTENTNMAYPAVIQSETFSTINNTSVIQPNLYVCQNPLYRVKEEDEELKTRPMTFAPPKSSPPPIPPESPLQINDEASD